MMTTDKPVPSFTPVVLRTDHVFVPDAAGITLVEPDASFMSRDMLVMRCRGPIPGARYLVSMGKLEEIAAREGWTLRLTQLESGVFAYVVV